MSQKFNLKQNLLRLNGACVWDALTKSGDKKKVILIPVEENDIFIGEKGAYLSSVLIPSDKMGESTHFNKLSVERAKFAAMSEEERNKIPIIGDMKPFKQVEPEGNAAVAGEYVAPDPAEHKPGETDDLPF